MCFLRLSLVISSAEDLEKVEGDLKKLETVLCNMEKKVKGETAAENYQIPRAEWLQALETVIDDHKVIIIQFSIFKDFEQFITTKQQTLKLKHMNCFFTLLISLSSVLFGMLYFFCSLTYLYISYSFILFSYYFLNFLISYALPYSH